MRPKPHLTRAVWAHLTRYPDTTVRGLALRFGLSNTAAYYHIQKLMRLGYVARPRHGHDALDILVPLYECKPGGAEARRVVREAVEV